MGSSGFSDCLKALSTAGPAAVDVPLKAGATIGVYPRSIVRDAPGTIWMARHDGVRWLWVEPSPGKDAGFKGTWIQTDAGRVLRCPLDHTNATVIREILPWTRASVVGQRRSLGCGDRLGLANPGHLRALAGKDCAVILAQQSVRELERTGRQAEDVMDAASWAVLQEGFRSGFGADADHLKTTQDIERYARAGYTMFTLDVGAHVINAASTMPMDQVRAGIAGLPWDVLEDTPENIVERFARPLTVGEGIHPGPEEVLRALLKYGGGIAQAVRLARYIAGAWNQLRTEIELSVDETDSPTTPVEHLVVAGELRRLGVKVVSLAPRFIGEFQKGIEYRGDLAAFTREFRQHLSIADAFGPYKISIHSGSDKFAIYRVVGEVGTDRVHVKTAGTSWLEALRAVATADPELFREILRIAVQAYPADRATYHVTAETARVRDPKDYRPEELRGLLDDEHARQILHVTYGSILNAGGPKGPMKPRVFACLNAHEELHYECLARHFRRHLDPLLGRTPQ